VVCRPISPLTLLIAAAWAWAAEFVRLDHEVGCGGAARHAADLVMLSINALRLLFSS